MNRRNLLRVLPCLGLLAAPVSAQSGQTPESEGAKAISRFHVPPGMEVTLFAEEPMLANPVAIDVDHQGRVYVAETYRQETEGVPDNRSHRYWTEDDLRLQTAEERGQMYLKYHPEYATEWTDQVDRIVRLVDSDGDGKADVSGVYATGFQDLLDGTGAGVLARGNEVWYTCIPNLWKLTDTDGDGQSDTREVLHHGYGVRVALRGHDLHGLVQGPDGRLYFSVGDRGYNVMSKEGKHLFAPGSGAVFRCELDGSQLEVFATGLRNPQELAFDDRGDLFTGDNNCDAGDAARLVYVMEGGDCGWSMNFQYLPDRGPWMSESWWKPRFDGQPAFLNPPIANLAAGPSGLAYYPGVGLPDSYAGSFFLVDFRGGAGGSGVYRFTTRPDGAGFALDQTEEFWWGVLATDVTFGPDGSLYLSDWVEGWTGAGKGRIYRMQDPTLAGTDEVQNTAKILGQGMANRSLQERIGLLQHPDYRVRLESQLSLMAEGANAIEPLSTLARSQQASLHGRMHAIWALSRLHVTAPLELLLRDQDPEIRAQAARGLGECPDAPVKSLLALMMDPNPRVVYHAVQSLGARGDGLAVVGLAGVLKRNEDRDRFLRHAASYALSRVATPETLAGYSVDLSSSVALGAVLALRHQRSELLSVYLRYSDPRVVTEAAIAIYDLDLVGALPALVDLLERYPRGLPDAVSRRALHAANRLNRIDPVLAFALESQNSEALRTEAADLIAHWMEPKEFDAMRNESRHYGERTGLGDPQAMLVASKKCDLVAVRSAIATLAGFGDPAAVHDALFQLLADPDEAPAVRIASLQGLHRTQDDHWIQALGVAAQSKSEPLRAAAKELGAQLMDQAAALSMQDLLTLGDAGLQAERFRDLQRGTAREADSELEWAMRQLEAGKVAPGAQLELLEAVEARAKGGVEPFVSLWDAYQARMETSGPFQRFAISLEGGDAAQGQKIFYENATASCARCHAIDGQPGVPSEVGPNLSSVGLLRSREELLQSILQPAAQIAPGFEIYSDGHALAISAMLPNYADLLTPAEVRDLVAYLASLRKPKHVAVFVYSAGFEHEVAKRDGENPSLVESQWMEWDQADPRFEVERVMDPRWFQPSNLAKVDAVFFYTTGELPLAATEKQALRDFVEAGGGFVGAHCATDTFYEWAWYGDMIGAYFAGHPWDSNSKVSIRVEDPDHAACSHLDNPWSLTDEIYQFRAPYSRERQHVLLSLDPTGTDMTKAGMNREDGDYAVAWTRHQGKGKVFYTSLGHREDVWRNPQYRDHLVAGLLWAAR
ncbi:MAG: ThuA domain-containing protein [Planctomycetes bacterium]|nr:ThuA domain-containing protein [Planctomycetota bacterium]